MPLYVNYIYRILVYSYSSSFTGNLFYKYRVKISNLTLLKENSLNYIQKENFKSSD